MEIANNIKEIRKILSFSQEDFAREIGVSFASVNRWERGKTKPSRMALKAIDDFCQKHNISYSLNGGSNNEDR